MNVLANWMITIPKTVPWLEYRKELIDAETHGSTLNYRVRGFPKGMCSGDRCYIVHNGRVRGWMLITGLAIIDKPWTCTTTGKVWPLGKYIQRSGAFHPITDGPKIKGFRGIRRFLDN